MPTRAVNAIQPGGSAGLKPLAIAWAAPSTAPCLIVCQTLCPERPRQSARSFSTWAFPRASHSLLGSVDFAAGGRAGDGEGPPLPGGSFQSRPSLFPASSELQTNFRAIASRSPGPWVFTGAPSPCTYPFQAPGTAGPAEAPSGPPSQPAPPAASTADSPHHPTPSARPGGASQATHLNSRCCTAALCPAAAPDSDPHSEGQGTGPGAWWQFARTP